MDAYRLVDTDLFSEGGTEVATDDTAGEDLAECLR